MAWIAGDTVRLPDGQPAVVLDVDADGLVIVRLDGDDFGAVEETVRKFLAEGFKVGLQAVKEGVTERDVQKAMWNYYISQGLEDTIMQGGIIIRSHPFGKRRTDFPSLGVERPACADDRVVR